MSSAAAPSRSVQEIRRAGVEDADAISACVTAAYAPWIAVIGLKPAPMTQDYGETLRAAQVFVVDGHAGLDAVLVLRREHAHFLLENIAVHPNAQGTGLGRRLLALAEREALAQGFMAIALYTHERMAANIALYCAYGYVEFARRTESGFARVFMRKMLITPEKQIVQPERMPTMSTSPVSPNSPVARWHAIAQSQDASGLDDLLADDAVFISPVVHTPQRGKAVTKGYLSAAFAVLFSPSFHYVREIVGPSDAVLEFETEVEGVLINGVDLIKWNADGKIVEFKVMVRPLKAMALLHERMAAMLAAAKGAR